MGHELDSRQKWVLFIVLAAIGAIVRFAVSVRRDPGVELGTRVTDAAIRASVFVIVALVCVLVSMLIKRLFKRFF